MGAEWSKADWRGKPRVQMPDYPDAAALRGGRGAARLLSAAGLRRRGAQAASASSPRWPRAGRSCCRAATAPRASPSSPPTTSATPSR